MFAPTKTWRRWHRKVNVAQKRYILFTSSSSEKVLRIRGVYPRSGFFSHSESNNNKKEGKNLFFLKT
jgi:hypothetical protein